MRIECPECSKGYVLPDRLIPKKNADEGPKRMRCHKCKAVFTVAVREEAPPAEAGYEEFSDPSKHSDSEEGDSQTADEAGLCLELFDYSGSEPAQVGDALELSSYVEGKRRSAVWFVAMILGFLVLVGCTFMIYVASQNEWVLSFRDMDTQIQVAFYGVPPTPEAPSELDGLKVTVDGGYKIFSTKDRREIVVVTGTVENTTPDDRTHVILKGTIVDSKRVVRATTPAPCGWMVKDKRLKKLPAGKAETVYKRKGRFFNCMVKNRSKKKYKMFFDDLPDGYNDTFSIQVVPSSAQMPEVDEPDH